MNQDDKKIDSFDIHVWSDTDHNGITLTISEIDIDSGIFEASVFFTTEDESKGTQLLVEDAVYAKHKSSVNVSRIINEFTEQYMEPDYLCPPEKVFDWDICVDKCPIGQIEINRICHSFENIEITTGIGKISLFFILVCVAILSAFVIWRIRK